MGKNKLAINNTNIAEQKEKCREKALPLPLSGYGGYYLQYKKKNNGITLIALIITIVVTLILTSVTIYVGTDSLQYSKVTKFVSYMQAIQKKVDLISEYGNYAEYGSVLTEEQKEKLSKVIESSSEITTNDVGSEKNRYFDTKKILEELEIENVDEEIVVNFENREVISLSGIEYEGKIYYTQYNLPGGQVLANQNQEINRDVSLGEIETVIEDGLNAKFIIKGIKISNGTLSYGKKDDSGDIKWRIITNYTKKSEEITTNNITEAGVYYFKLVDNTTKLDNIDENGNYPEVNLRLTNSPQILNGLNKETLTSNYNYSNLDSSKWAYITGNNGQNYIWVPRFVYKNDENNVTTIEFLRGVSDISTSGTYIDSPEWTLPTVFTNNKELTGVWVEVDVYPKENLNIIEILSSSNIF